MCQIFDIEGGDARGGLYSQFLATRQGGLPLNFCVWLTIASPCSLLLLFAKLKTCRNKPLRKAGRQPGEGGELDYVRPEITDTIGGGGHKSRLQYPQQIPKSPMTFHVNFLSICRQRGRPLTVNHITTLLKYACRLDLLG